MGTYRRLLYDNVLDDEVLDIKVFRVRVRLGVLQEAEDELNGLLGPATFGSCPSEYHSQSNKQDITHPE